MASREYEILSLERRTTSKRSSAGLNGAEFAKPATRAGVRHHGGNTRSRVRNREVIGPARTVEHRGVGAAPQTHMDFLMIHSLTVTGRLPTIGAALLSAPTL
jgi:hypothetical protein